MSKRSNGICISMDIRCPYCRAVLQTHDCFESEIRPIREKGQGVSHALIQAGDAEFAVVGNDDGTVNVLEIKR